MKKEKVLIVGDSSNYVLNYVSSNGESFSKLSEEREFGGATLVGSMILNLGFMPEVIAHEGKINSYYYDYERRQTLPFSLENKVDYTPIDVDTLPHPLKQFAAVIVFDENSGAVDESLLQFVAENAKLSVFFTDKKSPPNAFVISTKQKEDTIFLNHAVVSYKGKSYSVEVQSIQNYVGSVETFIAAFTTNMIKSKNVEHSINFANVAREKNLVEPFVKILTQEDILTYTKTFSVKL